MSVRTPPKASRHMELVEQRRNYRIHVTKMVTGKPVVDSSEPDHALKYQDFDYERAKTSRGLKMDTAKRDLLLRRMLKTESKAVRSRTPRNWIAELKNVVIPNNSRTQVVSSTAEFMFDDGGEMSRMQKILDENGMVVMDDSPLTRSTARGMTGRMKKEPTVIKPSPRPKAMKDYMERKERRKRRREQTKGVHEPAPRKEGEMRSPKRKMDVEARKSGVESEKNGSEKVGFDSQEEKRKSEFESEKQFEKDGFDSGNDKKLEKSDFEGDFESENDKKSKKSEDFDSGNDKKSEKSDFEGDFESESEHNRKKSDLSEDFDSGNDNKSNFESENDKKSKKSDFGGDFESETSEKTKESGGDKFTSGNSRHESASDKKDNDDFGADFESDPSEKKDKDTEQKSDFGADFDDSFEKKETSEDWNKPKSSSHDFESDHKDGAFEMSSENKSRGDFQISDEDRKSSDAFFMD